MTAGRHKRPALFCPDVQWNIAGQVAPRSLAEAGLDLYQMPVSQQERGKCLNSRVREAFKSIGVSLIIALVTLAVLEAALRIADLRELRETLSENSLAYDFDAELGWIPVAGSTGTINTFRTTHYKHNSLGLRD